MKQNLIEACESLSEQLDTPDEIDGAALLRAIAEVESSGGHFAVPRFEPAYAPGGYYYRKALHVREAWREWGDWASCSYSAWQILFVTAQELGYKGSPVDLREPNIAGRYVVAYLNRRVFKRRAKTIAQVGDAYNSGSFADQMVPEDYIVKLEAAYRKELGR